MPRNPMWDDVSTVISIALICGILFLLLSN